MDFFYAIVVLLAAVAAVTVQREMVSMQYLGSGGAPGSAADRMIIYSTRVVTPEGVIPAAVHVFDGRIQDIVPSDKPPKNPKVRVGNVPASKSAGTTTKSSSAIRIENLKV